LPLRVLRGPAVELVRFIIGPMKPAPTHHARVFGSPWEGVYGTHMESARHFGKHWHAVYGLGLVEHGAQSSASGRGTVEAYAGDLITTNPGEVHDGQPLGGPSRRWRMVYLDPGVVASMVGDPTSTGMQALELTRPVIQDARLAKVLLRLLDQLEHRDAGLAWSSAEALACEELLVHTCALLLEGHASAPRSHGVDANVQQVRDRLADAPLEPPTLTQMALMAGISKYQLLRRFEKCYGVTPYAWLLQQRAERASGLIRRGESLALAAASCGFADQSHMTRTFARQFGFTPGALKKMTAPTVR